MTDRILSSPAKRDQGEHVSIPIGDAALSGLVDRAPRERAWLTLAHGAGAGMTHPFMTALAASLAARGISVLRYNFPFAEKGSRRPDSPAVATRAVAAAVATTLELAAGRPVFAGGKSFGGRMTSEAAAAALLPAVRGLVFLGFPLHPAGKPAISRAAHLTRVTVPMLFLQGTRDALADLGLMAQVIEALPGPITLSRIAQADHAFHVPAASGRSDEAVRRDLTDQISTWIDDGRAPPSPASAHIDG